MTLPYKLIDLTHTLETTIPTWSGDCGFHQDLHVDYTDCPGEDTFRVMKIRMYMGIGTHMDAPSHCIQGGKNIDEFTLDELCMPCVVIDVSHKADERYSVTLEDIALFEDMHGPIPPNACVMIKTGWEKFWQTPKKYHNDHLFPSVSPEVAYLLLKKGVAALGTDTLSADRPEDGFKVHKAFLKAGKILLENVAHLDEMPLSGSYIMALPLKIKNGTEAPLRLVGLIKRTCTTEDSL
jgi:kynurenine formamidase